jgi:hypothetical protein
MAIQYVDRNGDAVGTVSGPYTISASNDKLTFTIDGGAAQNFTLTSGTRTAAQIVADLAGLTGATASVVSIPGGAEYVRIRTTSALGTGSTILVGAPANNANATLGFLATTYNGGANVSASFVTSTKANIRDNLETQLLAAGWLTISGSGTTNLLMQSAMTPQGLRMRLRIRDNGNTCLVLSIENAQGSRAHASNTNSGAQLNPGSSRNWRIIANKYQAFLFEPGGNVARGYAGWGVLWIPPWLEGQIWECIWLSSNASSDSDTTVRGSFRGEFGTRGATNQTGNQQIIGNGNMWENANNTGNDNITLINLLVLWQGCNMARNALSWYRWHDDAALILEPFMAFTMVANIAEEAKVRGTLWDAFISMEQYAIDTTTTMDGRNWWNITNNNAGGTDTAHGSLFIATS